MNPFQSLGDYEHLVYSLAENHPSIRYSTLVLARRSPGFAVLTGEIIFNDDFHLVVFERLTGLSVLSEFAHMDTRYGAIARSFTGTIRRNTPLTHH